MAKATRVHSTPRRTAPKIKAAKRRPSRDAGLLDLADRFIAVETEVDRLNDAVNAMNGVIAKARCVEKNLCDGRSACYDPDAQFAASMAKDLLALSGRGKAVA